MFELKDKTALVTGATGGIGGALARALYAQGATLAISGRQTAKLEALAAELGARVHICPCELADRAAVGKLIDEAVGKLGRLDILLNNAGLTRDNLFMVMKDEQWDEVITVNLTSTFMLMRAAARAMVRARTGYHQYFLDQWCHRQPRPGQLRRIQGRHDRHVKIASPRGRLAGHHG